MKIIINVERVSPGDKWRMTTPNGEHEFITAETWTRTQSHEALDLFENVYHFTRKNIRFNVR